jgi:hypothetical protein
VLSTSGIALATEVGEQDDNTGIKAEEPAEIPDEEEPAPAKDETPANDSKEEEPYEGAKEDPAKEDNAAPDEDTKGKEEPKEDSSANREESVKLGKDNKELAEDYYNHVFGITRPTKRSSYNYASAFTGRDLELYNYLNEQVAKVASGEISTTQFETSINFTAEELGLTDFSNFDAAVDAATDILDSSIPGILRTLIQANPYNFYWFASKYGWGYHYSFDGITFTTTAKISFYVSENYKAGNDDFTVDNSYGDKVNAAYTNAMEIVDQYAPLDDYNKLKAYKNKICELTDYNHPAADDDDTPYGNPWQMIWVFDGDPDTKVVCEGYSKAFLFLCQKSTFRSSDVYAITVTGLMDGGAHMWNIVHMDDGQDYLVDVTNCDSGFSLFLRGKDTTQTVSGGYYIKVGDSRYIQYVYDAEYTNRDIPTTDYSVNTNPGPITEPVFVSSHSMILAGRIGLKFLVDFPENYDTSSCYMVFTSSDGRTIRVDYDKSETGEGFENKRAFTFYMNALELADTVTATLHYGDGKTTTDVYSVISYISDTKSSSYGSDFNLMNLLYKLQAYGYYLQKSGWNDGRTHTQIPIPVSTLEETLIPKTVIVDGCLEETMSSVSSYNMTLTQEGTLIADVKLALSLNSQTDLKIAVKPASDVAITSNASEYSIVTIGNEDYYVFTAEEIGPKKLGENKTITIKTDKGDATVSVSPMYYVKQVLNSSAFETDQKNAMIAYYNYFDAAKRYKN